jgi:diguanylate cyclase (GGDEF)-like protein
MSLRLKFLAIMALPMAVLVAATFALFASRNVTSAALADERHTTALHDAFGTVLVDLNNAETTTRGYIITHKPSYLTAFNQDKAKLPGDLLAIRNLVNGDPADAAGSSQLDGLANQRLSILQTTQIVAQVGDRKDTAALVELMNGGKGVSDRIAALIDTEETHAAGELAVTERRLDKARNVSFLIGIVGLPLGMFASLIVVLLFMERVVTRVRSMEEIARSLEQGMPMREPSTSADELGRLERVLVFSGTRVVQLQSELRHMGTSDALTRLMNRRGFLPTAEHQLEVAKRKTQRMALAFVDLDGLKRVNDTLGHSSGDGMITEAAYIMRETFRASDLIARMGGDEFCILFEADSEGDAESTLQRLQEAAKEANAQEGRPFTLSLSAGFAMFDPQEPRTLDQLLAAADEKMYASKRAKAGARPGAVSAA